LQSLFIKCLCSFVCTGDFFMVNSTSLPTYTTMLEGGERSKMRGRSWVHLLWLIFYRGYPLFINDYEGENKVLFFWPFQRKNALISTTIGFSAMENSMMTFIIYARPRRDAMHVHALNTDRRSVLFQTFFNFHQNNSIVVLCEKSIT
jgi:hypothetical protein